MTETVVMGLLLVGASFLLLAAFGIVRMPDLFTRMSAATKGTTFGVGCMLAAVAVYFPGIEITTRVLAGVGFFFFTAPVGAHMIARAAYLVGVPLWEGTVRDELRGQYNPRTHQLGHAPAASAGSGHMGSGRPGFPHRLRRAFRWLDRGNS
jgi:multicomponent Na+:H+ antiporter subunit G